MEGYRSLESGDLRVSESGIFRTTEGFNLGEVSLAAVGTKLTASVFGSQGLVIGEATSSCVVVGTKTGKGATDLSGAGVAQSHADVFLIVSSSLSGVGSQGSSARAVRAAVAPLSGSSVLAPTSTKIRYLFSDLSGTGTTTLVSTRIRYGNYIGFSEEATRVTQAGDTRITESGDVRVTGNLVYNQAESSLVATGLFTKFFSTAYIKVSGVWKQVLPSTNYQGVWKVPSRIYKNISENWKRIY